LCDHIEGATDNSSLLTQASRSVWQEQILPTEVLANARAKGSIDERRARVLYSRAKIVISTNLRQEQVWLVVGSLMILATVALAGALFYTRDVMIPFVLAIFITTMVSPLVDFLVLRWRLPSWLATLIALLIVLAVLTLLSLALIAAVQAIVHTAGEYSKKVAELSQTILGQLKAHRINVDQSRIGTELEGLLPGVITEAAGTVTAVLSHGLLIMIFVVFLLAGRNPRQTATGIYTEIEATIREYITTKSTISAATGLLVGLILWMLGLRMAALFGLLAFLLNFIPSIGALFSSLLPIPIAVTQFDNPIHVVAAVALPGIVHLMIGNVVEPRLMGRGLELHPVTVLLALAFWGLLWGVMGMVLAVPIVAVLKIVLSRLDTTRPIGELLAGKLPGEHRPPVE
jgi:AI-2 transport protein TqsA